MYRQPPTPLSSAPRLPPFEPAQPESTRSDSLRPLAVESEAPESCFALISWATCDPAPYCPILPVRLATEVDETASMPGGFAVATDCSRNLSPPLGRSDVSYGGAPFRCRPAVPSRQSRVAQARHPTTVSCQAATSVCVGQATCSSYRWPLIRQPCSTPTRRLARVRSAW